MLAACVGSRRFVAVPSHDVGDDAEGDFTRVLRVAGAAPSRLERPTRVSECASSGRVFFGSALSRGEDSSIFERNFLNDFAENFSRKLS